ncbi:pyridoxamine 5'-phosphate oxidase family protein [Rhodococcus aetherivorans]|uniref:pyridoxamine 5'-phosphate oxidase family protein n=1 Tax=Rhodococcus aetherivorans TaxID=191292 RepID=UPI0034A0CF0E
MTVPEPAAALAPGECMALLRSVRTGRLLHSDHALPAVRPVTFAAPDGEVVVPTGGDRWYERFHGTVLAFQAEQFDPATRTGWSVVALGHARLVHGTDGLIGFDDAAVAPWQGRPEDRYLVIDAEHVSGLRLALPDVPARQPRQYVPAATAGDRLVRAQPPAPEPPDVSVGSAVPTTPAPQAVAAAAAPAGEQAVTR